MQHITLSANMGVNLRAKSVTQVHQQRPELPTVTLTWHACKYKVHKLHQWYILKKGYPPPPVLFQIFSA